MKSREANVLGLYLQRRNDPALVAGISAAANRSERLSLLHSRLQRQSSAGESTRSRTASDRSAILQACAIMGAAGCASILLFHDKSAARCCGIVGYIGTGDVEPVLMEGIEILQNRGYDSCGITTIGSDGQLITTKFASKGTTSDCIQLLKKEAPVVHGGHHIGIAHTRWATHGGKTDTNAHPHMDWKKRISLVHNGSIDNFAQLKKDLIAKGCIFMTETDTEVIANLIGYHLELGHSFEDAVAESISQLQGTWGLCVIHKDYPDRIVLARNGSPLLVGSSDGQVFIASEPAALARHTSQYLMLKDGEIAIVTSKGIDQLLESRDMHRIASETVETSPDPFPHWTLKEIFEQPQSLARALNYGGRIMAHGNRVKLGGLDQNTDLLAIRNLLLAGCGTSLYAGMYGEQLMQWLACFDQVRAVDATELEQHMLPRHDAGILLLSQSGETLDTIRACQVADEHGVRKFSIVNAVGSLLARMTSCGVYLNAGREVAVASTKAFTSQVSTYLRVLVRSSLSAGCNTHPVAIGLSSDPPLVKRIYPGIHAILYSRKCTRVDSTYLLNHAPTKRAPACRLAFRSRCSRWWPAGFGKICTARSTQIAVMPSSMRCTGSPYTLV